jgi:hypothetical protein
MRGIAGFDPHQDGMLACGSGIGDGLVLKVPLRVTPLGSRRLTYSHPARP